MNTPTDDQTDLRRARLREWLGCFAVSAWAYGLVYSCDAVVAGTTAYLGVLVMFLVVSMIATSIGCDDDLPLVSRLALYTGPLAAVCTASMSLAPDWAHLLLYVIAMLSLGPLFVRRLEGAVQVYNGTGGQPILFLLLPAVFAFHAVWTILPVSQPVRFALLAVIGLAGVWGVGRPLASPAADGGRTGLSRRTMWLLFAHLIVLLVVDLGYQLALVQVAQSWEGTFPLSWLLAGVVSGLVAFIAAAVMARGATIPWFLVALACATGGIVLSMVERPPGMEPILLLLYGIGAGVTLFQILRFWPGMALEPPRTMLLHSIGIAYLSARAVALTAAARQPWAWQGLGLELPRWFFLVLLILTILLLPVTTSVLDRERTWSLAKAVLPVLTEPHPDAPQERLIESTAEVLDPVNRKVTTLLLAGDDTATIARKLAIPAGEIRERIDTIRLGAADPVAKLRADALALVVERYGLTRREAEILDGVRDGKRNAEIAIERFVSENTVKFHVRNLLTKLQVTDRRELRELVERIEAEVASD